MIHNKSIKLNHPQLFFRIMILKANHAKEKLEVKKNIYLGNPELGELHLELIELLGQLLLLLGPQLRALDLTHRCSETNFILNKFEYFWKSYFYLVFRQHI